MDYSCEDIFSGERFEGVFYVTGGGVGAVLVDRDVEGDFVCAEFVLDEDVAFVGDGDLVDEVADVSFHGDGGFGELDTED